MESSSVVHGRPVVKCFHFCLTRLLARPSRQVGRGPDRIEAMPRPTTKAKPLTMSWRQVSKCIRYATRIAGENDLHVSPDILPSGVRSPANQIEAGWLGTLPCLPACLTCLTRTQPLNPARQQGNGASGVFPRISPDLLASAYSRTARLPSGISLRLGRNLLTSSNEEVCRGRPGTRFRRPRI